MQTSVSTKACAHHWIIEEAHGPTSRGKCKKCGLQRDFLNNPEDARIGQEAEPRREAIAV